MSAPLDDFDRRLQSWKLADAETAKAAEQLRRALLDGLQAEHADDLHRKVRQLRAAADRLITELLQDMKRMSGTQRDQLR